MELGKVTTNHGKHYIDKEKIYDEEIIIFFIFALEQVHAIFIFSYCIIHHH